MKVTLIKPSMYGMRSFDSMEPLAVAVLSALTPDNIDRVFYDDRLEKIPFDEPTSLVAITVETFTAKRAYAIGDEFRKRGVPVVLGGCHPTLLPEESLEHSDAVVIGDAENIWSTVLDDAARDSLKPLYQAPQSAKPLIAAVDRSIFGSKRYLPISLVQHGRGCRYSCDFCSVHALYRETLFQRSLPDVIDEIKSLPRENIVFFVDDNLFCQVDEMKEFLDAIIPLNIKWCCQISIDISRRPDLLDLMHRSGCIAVIVGLESLHRDNLRQMKKSSNMHIDLEYALRAFHDKGIMVYGTFIFGYDSDSRGCFDTTVEFSIKNKLFVANFNPLMPMPGTALYARLLQEDRLLYEKWWLSDTFRYGDTMFIPKGMAPEELAKGCFGAKKKFYSIPSILYRMLNTKANAGSMENIKMFLLANYVSRRELLQKQGKALGGGAT